MEFKTIKEGKMMNNVKNRFLKEFPNRITTYFRLSWQSLAIVAVTGIIYNIGLVAGPWFEGQLVQRLCDILKGIKPGDSMIHLALIYVFVILVVQVARAGKRFYVRRFAIDTSRRMRLVLYHSILHQQSGHEAQQDMGDLMTKAISDVDACTEGMRKFTTELFDTGVALVAYLVMLAIYDWRLTLLSCAFTPLAYISAQKLKSVVYHYNTAYKENAGRLSGRSFDRINNALTYRLFGQEQNQDQAYEIALDGYEQAAVAANVWVNTPQPVYNIISMTGMIFILYFGSKNVMGNGWTSWDIAAMTTYIACFTKMAVKSSKAAKLFNAVHKASVSWKRIKPMLKPINSDETLDMKRALIDRIDVVGVTIKRNSGENLFTGLDLSINPGEIIGVTGPVASGKSSLGLALLGEYPYKGSIRLDGVELSTMSQQQRSQYITYMGHKPQLLSDTIAENISLGDEASVEPYLKAVCMWNEVSAMPDGLKTNVGSGGIQLSGGQQARVALARTLYHGGGLIILDDPFSAVDSATEQTILTNLQTMAQERCIVIISHRVTHFDTFSRVVWLDGNGGCLVDSHEGMVSHCPAYAQIYQTQISGGDRNDHK